MAAAGLLPVHYQRQVHVHTGRTVPAMPVWTAWLVILLLSLVFPFAGSAPKVMTSNVNANCEMEYLSNWYTIKII